MRVQNLFRVFFIFVTLSNYSPFSIREYSEQRSLRGELGEAMPQIDCLQRGI